MYANKIGAVALSGFLMAVAGGAAANPNVYYGDPVTTIERDTTTETRNVNQALERSGGRASDNKASPLYSGASISCIYPRRREIALEL